ncbi:hypothetical protein CPB86DRAFT_527151 [Serendipita vermifera]|nr:hypothetical protein CPB86DRAFT_527151 [Serendipita vermifera]
MISSVLEARSEALTAAAIIEAARDLALTKWCSAIAVTVLIYDTLLTLGEEVELLWPKRWNIVKTLIYLNRLITFPYTVTWSLTHSGSLVWSDHGCIGLFMSTSVVAWLFFAMANWIMMSRTASLYENSRIFKWPMTVFFTVTYILSGTLIFISMGPLAKPGHIYYLAPFRICAIAFRPSTYGYIWIPALVFESAICFLTILKTYQKAITQYGMGSKILNVIFRDGIFYYLIIVALRAYNMYSWMTMPPSRLFLIFQIMWSLVCILTTRLQLNLLDAAYNSMSSHNHYQLSSLKARHRSFN